MQLAPGVGKCRRTATHGSALRGVERYWNSSRDGVIARSAIPVVSIQSNEGVRDMSHAAARVSGFWSLLTWDPLLGIWATPRVISNAPLLLVLSGRERPDMGETEVAFARRRFSRTASELNSLPAVRRGGLLRKLRSDRGRASFARRGSPPPGPTLRAAVILGSSCDHGAGFWRSAGIILAIRARGTCRFGSTWTDGGVVI